MILGIIIGGIVIYWQAKRKNLDPYKAIYLIIIIIISGLIGSRLGYVFLNFSFYQKDLLKIFRFWKGGFIWQGGFILAFLIIFLILKNDKENLGKWLDAGILGILIGHSIGRIGCFLNGCCYGITTNIPWAIKFPNLGDNLLRHPTQLYESLSYFLIFCFLLIYSQKIHPVRKDRTLNSTFQGPELSNRVKLKNGSLFFIGTTFHELSRFIIEYFRFNTDFIYQGKTWYLALTYAQLTALIIITISLLVLLKINYRKAKIKNNY